MTPIRLTAVLAAVLLVASSAVPVSADTSLPSVFANPPPSTWPTRAPYYVGQSANGPGPNSLSDHNSWGWATRAIRNALRWGIVGGYPDGTFKPQREITRGEFAAMLAKAMGNAYPDPTQQVAVGFADVTSRDWFYPYVQVLDAAGVITPTMYPNRMFDPNLPITRAEAAAWISGALRYFSDHPQGTPKTFTDVPSSGSMTIHPTHNTSVTIPVSDLQMASTAGIINGYPGGTFKPANDITRAEAAAMLRSWISPCRAETS